ncbi:MAG: hypothetical protein LBH01_01180 [Verrucomicrobiales bacterium]|jgi:hypothetical protein|nr:hypothetical protein [Verrucomicrobiales bacterium]
MNLKIIAWVVIFCATIEQMRAEPVGLIRSDSFSNAQNIVVAKFLGIKASSNERISGSFTLLEELKGKYKTEFELDLEHQFLPKNEFAYLLFIEKDRLIPYSLIPVIPQKRQSTKSGIGQEVAEIISKSLETGDNDFLEIMLEPVSRMDTAYVEKLNILLKRKDVKKDVYWKAICTLAQHGISVPLSTEEILQNISGLKSDDEKKQLLNILYLLKPPEDHELLKKLVVNDHDLNSLRKYAYAVRKWKDPKAFSVMLFLLDNNPDLEVQYSVIMYMANYFENYDWAINYKDFRLSPQVYVDMCKKFVKEKTVNEARQKY